MIRRFGEPVRPGQTYHPRPGAYAVLWRDGRVLLTCQADPVPEFQLPGGGIDAGESPMQALHREVCEETGWRIGAVRRLGAYRRFTYMPDYDRWAEKLCAVYLARPVRRLGPPQEPGHSAVWLPATEAQDRLANGAEARFLAALLR